MTRAAGQEPDIPEAVRPQWDELTVRAVPARQSALDELDRQNRRCRQLVVELLRGGVRRERLVGRPYRNSRLTQIQREEGLIRPRPSRPTRPSQA